MPVQNKVSDKATANKDKAEEEDVSSKGRTGEQLDVDVSSKDRDVFSKRRTGWTEVDGGVLRGGAPGSGSKDSVSKLARFVSFNHTKFSRYLFKRRSLTMPLSTRWRLKEKTSSSRMGRAS